MCLYKFFQGGSQKACGPISYEVLVGSHLNLTKWFLGISDDRITSGKNSRWMTEGLKKESIIKKTADRAFLKKWPPRKLVGVIFY